MLRLFIQKRTFLAMGIALLCAGLPKPVEAVFFPLGTVLKTLNASHIHRGTEEVSRSPRATITPVSPQLPPYLPTLRWATTRQLEQQWATTKKLKTIAQQLINVERSNLRNLISEEVLPLSSIGRAFLETFERRDNFRDRIYASPELYALLKEAIPLIEQHLSGEKIMIGDVSQFGAGPLVYGTTVKMLQNTLLRPELSDFLQEAHRQGNHLVRDRVIDPQERFPVEMPRWKEIGGPIWVEEKMTGGGVRDGTTIGRVETRRFYRSGELQEVELIKWWKKKTRHMKQKFMLHSGWVTQGSRQLWRVQWLRGKQWFEADFTEKFKRSPSLSHLVRLRMATFDRKKPGSFQRERRYFISRLPSGGQKLIAWRQLYEAGHISHLNGMDADISYIMKKPGLLFSRSVGHIDVPKTRKWFEIMYEAARRSGVEIDIMLVDKKVKRRLLRGLPNDENRHPVWSLLAVSSGHDSHVHVRVNPGFHTGDRNASHQGL